MRDVYSRISFMFITDFYIIFANAALRLTLNTYKKKQKY